MPRNGSHRSFRILAAATLATGLIPLGLANAQHEPLALAGAFTGWTLAIYLGTAAGALMTGTAFAPGEPMRPGWLLLSASYAVLVPSRLLPGGRLEGLGVSTAQYPVLESLLGVASGALGLAAFLLLAGAWRESGLDTTGRASRVVARLVALVASLVLAGPDLVARFPAAAAGDPLAITDVLTDLLDGAIFVVAVPVARAALALGGGLVAWPWGLLTLSLFAWLGYDASVIWGGAAGLTPYQSRVLEECMRAVGACATLSAAVAQRWIMLAPAGGAGDPGHP